MGTMLDTLDRLEDAIAGVLTVDIDTLTPDELHTHTIRLQQLRSRLGIAAAGVLSRWDASGIWQADQSRTAAHRLSRETNTSIASAKRELGRARSLRTMPHTHQAVLDDRLSLDHVDLLGRANTPWRADIFAEHEETLVEECAGLRFHHATKAVQYWQHRVDAEHAPDGTDPDDPTPDPSSELHASTILGGKVVVNATLDALGGAAFVNELGRLEKQIRDTDLRDGIVRTIAQRRAAALIEMATRSATAPADGKRPAPLFTMHLGEGTFEDLCETAAGVVIHPSALRPWLDQAVYETVLFDGPTTVISVSNRRNFTGAVRRAIEARDRHCQHPSGCDTYADDCDVDHTVPHSQGGVTSQWNGRIQCPPHNRNRDLHDHGAEPLPERPVDRLDEIRARLRWQYRQEERARERQRRQQRANGDEPSDADAAPDAGDLEAG